LFGYAARPTLLVLAGCLVLATLLAGSEGLVGAAIGALVVVAFFGVDLVVARLTTQLSPVVTFLAFLGEYALKVVWLALLLVGLRDRDGYDPQVLGLTIGAGSVTWAAGLVVGSLRIRSFTLEAPRGPAQPSATSAGDTDDSVVRDT
jgi:ATP synthase protein I